MASTVKKERKIMETESDNQYGNKRNTRRGKPQQQIYRPGSGPLRKSATPGPEDTESDTNTRQQQQQNSGTSKEKTPDVEAVAEKMGDMSVREGAARRNRKPEQPLYVPRAVQQARYEDTSYQHVNGNYESNGGRSKRYSHKRRDNESYEDRRAPSPMHQPNRYMRQGSESRAHMGNTNWGRMRDTKSVEPNLLPNRNYNAEREKIHSKPPSGRRHSTIGMERMKIPNLELLPPRLRKRYLEDNKLAGPYQRVPEENWDGCSMTFQGSSTSSSHPVNYHHQQHHHPPHTSYQQQPAGYTTLPPNYSSHHGAHPNAYYSLPRGRGRLQHEYEPVLGGAGGGGGMARSLTPERVFRSPCNSRPQTPPPFANANRHTENVSHHQFNSRPETPVPRPDDNYSNARRGVVDKPIYEENNIVVEEKPARRAPAPFECSKRQGSDEGGGSYDKLSEETLTRVAKALTEDRMTAKRLEEQLSPVSPPTPTPEVDSKANMVLDWSEEVELNDRLEQEASDALTRSSSMASLLEKDGNSKSSSSNREKRTPRKKSRRRSKRRNGSKTRDRDNSCENSQLHSLPDDHRNARATNQNNYEGRDKSGFKVPEPRGRRRRSRDRRDQSFDRRNKSRASRESSFERNRRSSTSEHENWREEIIRSRQNSEREGSKEPERKELDVNKKGGIIILPAQKSEPTTPAMERPRYPESQRKTYTAAQQQKSLFDPNNPNKPIIIKSASPRVKVPGFSENTEAVPLQPYTTDQYGNIFPTWYNEQSENFKSCHYPELLRDVAEADRKLQCIINHGGLFLDWGNVQALRCFLLKSLEYLLCKDLKFCQTENVDQHFWKILFHNIIEMTRKALANSTENKDQYKGFLLWLIDEGTKYFEGLVERLEQTYKFKVNNFLGSAAEPQKNLGYIGLALVSTQKIYLFLGDLGRYREQLNEVPNYGKCRQWYIKAHEINPKNGRPYNQLAVLAVCSRRKLDAVYYYMRSLMSSNPAPGAKEYLISLFDDNRKKYEQGERKRREERLERQRQYMKEKESESTHPPNSLRKEIWIHPDSGRRIHRTRTAIQEQKALDSEEEDLASLSSVEVNKRFVTSYLHVHGKLITKIGMESFHEAALQMLKEFRALLQHSPVPLPCNRFLQLLALNMFAIESTQLKDPELQSNEGYRSELQERALIVSLQMFSLILERCVSLLQEHLNNSPDKSASLPMDAQVLLPAIKIWCDWMLCHTSVWNPPPSTQDYRVGPPGDAWTRLASLMNLLEKLDKSAKSSFVTEQREDYEQVRLPEDSVLNGFTPLMIHISHPTYVPKDFDMEVAQLNLRLSKLIFFGTVFLCGVEPPVLKLEFENDFSEYVSVVCTSSSRDSPPSPAELDDVDDLMVESFSEDEEIGDEPVAENAPLEIRELLTRKVELEKRQRNQELHRQRVKKILRQSVVSVHIEVRPKYLVPDTNCFIDYLTMIKTIAEAHYYTLMVPLVVLNELEGLTKGGKTPVPSGRSTADPQHVIKVAASAKQALEFLANRHPYVKCMTTKGTILTSTTFTAEDDSVVDVTGKNDDKILSACLALCKESKEPQAEGEPRKLFRDVVLLTEDRNLRVKALARDVPVRELPDFLQWAGLG